MHELLPTLARWRQQSPATPIAIATVVQVYGSAPRPVGAKMAVTAGGEMIGSVSGGCVEGAVAQEAMAVLASGQPRLVEYGIADELAQTVGLACGGIIQVFITPLTPAQAEVWQTIAAQRLPAVIVTHLDGPSAGEQAVWSPATDLTATGMAPLAQSLVAPATAALAAQQPQRVTASDLGSDLRSDPDPAAADLLLDVYVPPPRLIIVGAVHIAIPLVTYARTLGYHTVVVDARGAFATAERFAHAHELIVRWPADLLPELQIDRGTDLVFLTHDEKIDTPALVYALQTEARYIGVLGGHKTNTQRRQRLLDLGVDDISLARLHAPIGLELGGRTPEEIALAIMAEIIAMRHGRRGRQIAP